MTKENGTPQMTDERQFISERLSAYVEERKADDDPLSLRVLSEAVGINRRYLQAILRGEHTLAGGSSIRDEYYEKVRDFLSQEHKSELPQQDAWRHFDSTQFRFIIAHLNRTREEGGEMTLIAPSGYGKSYAAEYFKERYRLETVLVKCSSDLQQSRALSEVSRQLGVRTSTDGVLQRRYIQEGIERFTRIGGKPLLIFDEAENIRPQTAGRIKALYDQLRRHDEGALCGFALIGTPDLVEYWDRATHNQIPGAAQFSRRLLKQNAAFQVPDVLDYECFFEAHGLRRPKIAWHCVRRRSTDLW